LTKYYQTSNPKYGYNYFVGDNKPDSKQHLLKYKTAKAQSNVNRATNGQMKRTTKGKNLPANINHRISRKKDGTICGEGYFVQIKINGKLYNKAFLSMNETMESKLEQAKKQLEKFRQEASKTTYGSKRNYNNK
jgi:hypothetical protein